MNSLRGFTLTFLFCGLASLPAPAAYTSLYVFGDGVSTTTNNTQGGTLYYGNRFTNGRVWVELLAERQGILFESNKNWSYFGDYSSDLVANVGKLSVPPDASSSLFVIWVANADFVYNVNTYPTNNTVAWSNAIVQSLTNHWRAITNLYAKGARTLVMPNAVDLMKVPAYVYSPTGNKGYVRQRIKEFNAGFANLLNQARSAYANLTIYSPDLFSLLDNMVTNAASYGLTNALFAGESVAVLDDPAITDYSLNGPGTNHIFWDDLDPTAKAHAVLADVVQQLLSPVRISQIWPVAGSNRLDLTNLPVGRDGVLEGSTNLLSWHPWQTFPSTNVTQSLLSAAPDSPRFYRLRFPFSWTWP